jgi:hypothetical protein
LPDHLRSELSNQKRERAPLFRHVVVAVVVPSFETGLSMRLQVTANLATHATRREQRLDPRPDALQPKLSDAVADNRVRLFSASPPKLRTASSLTKDEPSWEPSALAW